MEKTNDQQNLTQNGTDTFLSLQDRSSAVINIPEIRINSFSTVNPATKTESKGKNSFTTLISVCLELKSVCLWGK